MTQDTNPAGRADAALASAHMVAALAMFVRRGPDLAERELDGVDPQELVRYARVYDDLAQICYALARRNAPDGEISPAQVAEVAEQVEQRTKAIGMGLTPPVSLDFDDDLDL